MLGIVEKSLVLIVRVWVSFGYLLIVILVLGNFLKFSFFDCKGSYCGVFKEIDGSK